MQGNAETCAAGYQKLRTDLEQLHIDQTLRDSLAHFHDFNTRQYKLYLPEAAGPLMEQVENPQPIGAANSSLWTKDTLEQGGMQYARRISALQQLSYIHIFMNQEFPGVDKEAIQALVHQYYDKPVSDELRNEVAQLKGSTASIVAYAALKIPRCPDVVAEHNDLRRRKSAYGYAVADAIRLQRLLNE